MIHDAKKSIDIYQQDLQDLEIRAALEAALEKGSQSASIMSEFPFGKDNPNKNIPNLKALQEKGAEVRLAPEKYRVRLL